MSPPRILPPVPVVTLKVVSDLSPNQPPGFLQLQRYQLTAAGVDQTPSRPFVYDQVSRRSLDAVVIVPYYRDDTGQAFVYLRSAARPPVLLRPAETYPSPDLVTESGLWELPAGLVESDENHLPGLVACAKRELLEELGFDVELSALSPLGKSTYPCPGVLGERHYFFDVSVEPHTRREPELDGSPVEALGAIITVSLKDALCACEGGELPDAKTELGLLRLARKLGTFV